MQGRTRRWLTTAQAAEHLGVSSSSLRKWSDKGLVEVYRTPGGQRRYDVEDLDRFLKGWQQLNRKGR